MAEGTQNTTIYSHAEFLSKTRGAILQTLDRRTKGLYLSKDAFVDSKWGGIPLVFGINHPNDDLLLTDPEKALAMVKGRFVGTVKSTNIDIVGHPKLIGELDVTDEEVNALIDEGKISLSTSIHHNGAPNPTKIRPGHVLLFIENEIIGRVPGDLGSWILNLETQPYGNVEYADPGYQADGVKRYPIDTEEHVRAAWSYINVAKNQEPYTADQLKLIKSRIISAAKSYKIEIQETNMADYTPQQIDDMLAWMKDHPDMVTEEHKTKMKDMMGGTGGGQAAGQSAGAGQTNQVQNMEKIDSLASENEALKAKVTAFEAKEAVSLQNLRDTQWQTIKKTLPVGLTHKAEDEAKLRAEFQADAAGFTVQHLADLQKPTGLPGEEGVQFTQQEIDDGAKEDAQAVEELREVGGMNRRMRRG